MYEKVLPLIRGREKMRKSNGNKTARKLLQENQQSVCSTENEFICHHVAISYDTASSDAADKQKLADRWESAVAHV